MKTFAIILASVVLSTLAAYAVVATHAPASVAATSASNPSKNTGSVYDRVIASKTIRCGYVSWPPYLSKDANTGKVSGFFADYMEEFGRAFDLKVQWTEEVAPSDIPTALNTGRIDAFCVSIGAVPTRAVNMDFSRVVAYFPFHAYVRKDDTRFDNNLDLINNPDVTLSTMEGEYTSILARTTFPKAKLMEITGNQGLSTLFLNVATNKADVVFQDPGAFRDYADKNPGLLRKASHNPVGAIQVGFPIKLGDTGMKRLFDYGVIDLENRFITRRLAQQHGLIGTPGREDDIYLPAAEYQIPANQ